MLANNIYRREIFNDRVAELSRSICTISLGLLLHGLEKQKQSSSEKFVDQLALAGRIKKISQHVISVVTG